MIDLYSYYFLIQVRTFMLGSNKMYTNVKLILTKLQSFMSKVKNENQTTKNYKEPYGCSVEATLSVIGGRWKPVILFHLMEQEVLRFNEMKRTIKDITQRMLTNQLRELEKDGVVNRKVYAQVPPRVEYRLTEYGKTLRPILLNMRQWGAEHMQRILK